MSQSFRYFGKSRAFRVDCFVLALGFVLGGCNLISRHSEGGDSSGSKVKDFGWDEDITLGPAPVQTPGTIQKEKIARNKDFCLKKSPEQCFTLILRIPSSDIIKDFGFSSLAMASGSPSFQKKLEEVCYGAWNHYKTSYETAVLRPVRQKWVNKIADFQCVYDFFSEEYIKEDASLPKGQSGASVRLTQFKVESVSTSADLNYVNFGLETTKLNLSYRSAFVKGPGSHGSWQPIKGLGVAPKPIVRKIGRDFVWKIVPERIEELVSQIDVAQVNDQTDQATKNFFKGAQTFVKDTLEAKTPFGPSLLLLGMGYHAWRDLCGGDQKRCHFSQTSTSKTIPTFEAAGELAPSSEANEFFRLTMIAMVEGVLDSIFESSEEQQLSKVYGLEIK